PGRTRTASTRFDAGMNALRLSPKPSPPNAFQAHDRAGRAPFPVAGARRNADQDSSKTSHAKLLPRASHGKLGAPFFAAQPCSASAEAMDNTGTLFATDRDRLGNPDCAVGNVGPIARLVHDFLPECAILRWVS